MEHLSRWSVVREAGGSMLTLDFLARQLLQALVMRLRFRTGASDMAVVPEVGEAGQVGQLCRVWVTEGDGGFTRLLQSRPIRHNRLFRFPRDPRTDVGARKPLISSRRPLINESRCACFHETGHQSQALFRQHVERALLMTISQGAVTLFALLPRRLPQRISTGVAYDTAAKPPVIPVSYPFTCRHPIFRAEKQEKSPQHASPMRLALCSLLIHGHPSQPWVPHKCRKRCTTPPPSRSFKKKIAMPNLTARREHVEPGGRCT